MKQTPRHAREDLRSPAAGGTVIRSLANLPAYRSRVVAMSLMAAFVAGIDGAARADSIYLTNGRVIHTAAARIEGDRVIFRQYGGEVAIPRETVVRIVDDDTVERVTAPTPRTSDDAADAAATGDDAASAEGAATDDATAASGVATATSGDAADASAQDDAPAEPEIPGNTLEYWVERVRAVDERIARAEAELERLPRYDSTERAMLRYSGQARYFMAERGRWQQMLEDFQATRNQLLEGARRAGITPGALRDALRD